MNIFSLFWETVQQNPIASLCIFLGLTFIVFTGLGRFEFQGFNFSVDSTSKKNIFWLGIVLLVAGMVMASQPTLSFNGIVDLFKEKPVTKLHRAAIKWDIDLAEQALGELEDTGRECDKMLVNLFRERARLHGMPTALNYVNTVQREVESWNSKCRYPNLEHSDQV